jgi:thiamine biosynthesis protein ThiC
MNVDSNGIMVRWDDVLTGIGASIILWFGIGVAFMLFVVPQYHFESTIAWQASFGLSAVFVGAVVVIALLLLTLSNKIGR